MTTTFHNAYGLVFQSELPMPELTTLFDADLQPDVSIRLGSVPEHLDNPTGKGVLYEASANEFLLKMIDVGRYWVRNGNEITIEPAAGADDNDVRVFMLGSCFGALLHQRQMLVLHAAAFGTPAGAVLFAGNSGIGKSTLLGEMLNRGYSMMVDDVCAVVANAVGDIEVVPGYPRTRLWADAAKHLEVETTGLDRTRPTLEKFERQLPENFWDKPAPMSRLYVLSSSNNDELKIEPLPSLRSFSVVLHNTYRRLFLEGLEMQAPHFSLASKVASTVRISRVTRPNGSFKLSELADLIEADMDQS
jgi:hypothetical protein